MSRKNRDFFREKSEFLRDRLLLLFIDIARRGLLIAYKRIVKSEKDSPIILKTSILQFPICRKRPFPHAGTTVPPAGNSSFPKWEQQFLQVGTAVSPSGNDGSLKWKRQ